MISTKGRYALRVMIDLVQQDTEQFVPLEEIAARQCISKKYLEIILRVLVKAKLIKGLRGKGGGYKLTRRPEEYTVWEILELTEGTMASVTCLQPGADVCEKRAECKTIAMWTRFDQMVYEFFNSITLADLAKE